MGRDAVAGRHLGGNRIERQQMVNQEPRTCLDHLGKSREARTIVRELEGKGLGQNFACAGTGDIGVRMHRSICHQTTPYAI